MTTNIAAQPIPSEVKEAMKVIADYCKKGNWISAIVYAEGGISFNTTSFYDQVLGPRIGPEFEMQLTAETVK